MFSFGFPILFFRRFADTLGTAMHVFPFGLRAYVFPAAAFAAVALFVAALPVRADEATTAAAASVRAAQAKRTTASFGTTLPSSPVSGATRPGAGFSNGFIYVPGAQPGMNIGGRLNVGKSHVYVPYYGNISGDPAHPTVQGTAGIAYGFRTWDISVFNGGIGTNQPTLPGVEAPKTNPNLSLSIRF
jgi:hypothetical protein